MSESASRIREDSSPLAVPELSGALQGLKVAEQSDLAAYNQAIDSGQQTGFGYYFPHLLGHNRPGLSAALLIEDAGSICAFRWKRRNGEPRLDLIVAPTPMNNSVMLRCLERTNDFNGDISAKILKIDDKDVEQVLRSKVLQVVKRKAQYLYSPATYLDLSGGRLRGIRRYVTKFEQLANLNIQSYSPRYKNDCLELLQRWRRYHRTAHGTQGGVGTTKRLLDLADSLTAPALEGEVVLIDGMVSAFSFGGQLRPGVGVFSEAKSDSSIAGLSIFQRYHFMVKRQNWTLINDGPDVGRGGLAQFKNRLRPVSLHQEYSARQD